MQIKLIEFIDNMKNIRSGVEYLQMSSTQTKEEKQLKLFGKNLKNLGLILLECTLLKKSYLNSDLNTWPKETLQKEVLQMKKDYDYSNAYSPLDKKLVNEDLRKQKKKLLDLVDQLVISSNRTLDIRQIYENNFRAEAKNERYTV